MSPCFTRSVAYDYGRRNIRVNSLSPGPIQTRISPKPGEPAYEWQCGQTLLKRVGRVEIPQEAFLSVLKVGQNDSDE